MFFQLFELGDVFVVVMDDDCIYVVIVDGQVYLFCEYNVVFFNYIFEVFQFCYLFYLVFLIEN